MSVKVQMCVCVYTRTCKYVLMTLIPPRGGFGEVLFPSAKEVVLGLPLMSTGGWCEYCLRSGSSINRRRCRRRLRRSRQQSSASSTKYAAGGWSSVLHNSCELANSALTHTGGT